MYRYRQSRFLSRSKKFRVSSLHNLFIHDNYRREGEKRKESVVVVVGIRLVSQHEPKSIIIFSSFLPESGSLWQSPGGVQYTVYYLVCGLVRSCRKKKEKEKNLIEYTQPIDRWMAYKIPVSRFQNYTQQQQFLEWWIGNLAIGSSIRYGQIIKSKNLLQREILDRFWRVGLYRC